MGNNAAQQQMKKWILKTLFQGHDNLISGFIAFLPKGDQEGMEMIKDEWFCMVVALLAHRKGFHDKLLCFCTLSSGQNQVSGADEAEEEVQKGEVCRGNRLKTTPWRI
ncbi:hypothetical protein F3Y22_tig00002511pilonHSYRG00345 [Hibiscus syriacus]|uniref:Uncharacterized protein n=1 Tax=Hibiscus syriacus TaxID=106335 RepID=A0A6A3CS49_HIBSY|nr:hypothetical protein F3Y22_tig00002511pilonHSYRG00345 [Hibiscus syriacus]